MTCLAAGLDDSQGDDESPEADDKDPTPEVANARNIRNALRKLHLNMGHAAPRQMVRILKHAGDHDKAIRLARDFRCDICDEQRKPTAHGVVKATNSGLQQTSRCGLHSSGRLERTGAQGEDDEPCG